ncbi:MAG TPA: DUF1549 and DUF1553 domain-containing protein, partial [Candidatus Solibacter sp.]|nr:DUF1549 and DUF1553 domain-containing protein [Candidatus Solibacter sp.]
EFRVLLGDRILEAEKQLGKAADDITLRVDELNVDTPLKAGLEWPAELSGYGSSGKVKLPIRVLRIGDTMIWSAPVELFSEIAMDVRSHSPYAHTFYFGYTNGWFGYLPTAKAFTEGGYEPQTSPFTPAAEADVTRAMTTFFQGGQAQKAADDAFIGARGRYWAFQRIERPAVPGGAANPIDAFLLDAQRKKNLTPSKPLDRAQLIRRVTYDLTGLPPTPTDVGAFVNDKSADAYEKVVDRLIASPQYGERWASKWLDVVRYADTNGYEHDGDRLHAWRYRDYVIRSFNAGKPYDRFIREQIAGDEMFSGDHDALIATGYLRAGSEHITGGNLDPEETRQEMLTEIATNVGQAFLGLTVNCARCHNHKFDPILQKDFYALQAVFAGAKAKDVEIVTPAEKNTWEGSQKAYKERLSPIENALKALARPYDDRIREQRKAKLAPESLEALNTPKEKRTKEQQRLAADAGTQITPAWDEVVETMPADVKSERMKLREKLHQVEATAPDPLPSAYAYVNTAETAPASFVLRMGDPHAKVAPVEPGVPRVLQRDFGIPAASPGRRTALANWLASRDNPLTARVMANRIWQFRMGDGLVRTPNDFGLMGDKPESHALLDWLAAEFMEREWSIKALDRLIVMSNAYRQVSTPDEAKDKIDPQNRTFWRMNRKRFDAEMIRDAALSVAGTLNLEIGGRPVRIPIEPEVYDLIFTEYERDGLWPVSPDPRVRNRRAIYLYNKRNVRMPLLAAFDQPDEITSCPVRPVSTHALQSLTLFNSDFMQEVSQAFAARLEKACGPNRACAIDTAWKLALSRKPHANETKLASEFFRTGGTLPDFCLALFNRNEFLYVP